MSRIKKASSVNTVLNEMVYTALYRASYEEKRHLHGKFLKAAIDEKTAMAFAATSSREEKEYVLAELGYEFYYVMKKKEDKLSNLKELLEKFNAGQRSAAASEIAKRGLYIMSNRDVARVMTLLTKTIHSPSFFMDLEILRQGYNIKKWQKKYSSSQDLTQREIDESSRVVAKLLTSHSLVSQNTNALVGCSNGQIKILLYLYATYELETSEDTLKNFFIGQGMSNTEFRVAFKNLKSDLNISAMKPRLWTITGSGIRKAGLFMKAILNSTKM